MPVLLSKLAIIEDGSPDLVVNLSSVLEGGEGATRQMFEIEPIDVKIENEQLYWPKANYKLAVAGLKGSSADKTQLDTWVDNQTDLIFAGIGSGLIFQGRGKLNNSPGANENVATWRIESAKQAVRGYDIASGGTGRAHSQMILSENGLNEYLWGDADGDGLADGWDTTGFITATFATGQQTLETDTTINDFQRNIWFPFEGVELTFSINNDSQTGSYTLNLIEIVFIDSAGANISSQTTGISSTGRKSVTATTPAGTMAVRGRFRIQASTGTATSKISDPAIRLGTLTDYVQR